MSLLVALLLLPQEDLTVLKAEDQPRKMLEKFLVGECGKHFEARKKAVAAMKTPEDVRKRQEELRARFVAALGGFPEKTPLNARVTGSLERDGYKVEKVLYESRPSHHVTANLYLPKGKGPFPGVLFPCGHYDNAKAAAEYQRACILLAKNGFAVLSFDPISQGERLQLVGPDGKPLAGRGTQEHTLVGVGALVVGECAASYLVWDGIRSLDYLAGRPEVDPKRLGCMGNSGGGTQTAYLMALDERIGCAVPNCFITSLERLFATIGPQDAEQNIPGQVAFGMEHADYLTLRAPRPTQISATTRDFFDIQGAWTTFREAKLVYGILGRGEAADLFEFNDQHAISRPMRQAGLRWFRRWLMGVNDAPVETDFPVAKDEELRVTPTGSVVVDLKGRTAFDFIAARGRELDARRAKLSKEDLLREVRRRLVLPASVPPAPAGRSDRPMVSRAGCRVAPVLYETAPGVLVPCLTWVPEKPGPRPCVVSLREQGKAAAENERLAQAGRTVLAADLRGWGETLPGGRKGAWEVHFGSDWKEAFLGLHLDRPLLGQRVEDLLALVGRVGEAHLVASGSACPVALHAAALDGRIGEVALEGMVISWSAVARTPAAVNQLTNVVPGALAAYDLPDLAAAIAPRPLSIKGPLDPAGKPVTQAQLDEAYQVARDAYRAAGAADKLVLQAAP